MSTSVKYIESSMRGAPQISGTPGSLIAALDALFTTGWGITTALSVTVVEGVATATLVSGETFAPHAVVLIEGATPAALNGEARVLTSSSTSITWSTTAPDGLATGTITLKYAPQTAWQKVYAGTNKAVYRSSHVQSRGHFLRVDDTGTKSARVRGFETMTDVDAGVGPFPTEAQMGGGGYWAKSAYASTATVPYRLFCDERFLILAMASYFPVNNVIISSPALGFGDPIELAPSGDAWGTLLAFFRDDLPVGSGTLSTGGENGIRCVAARALSGLGGSAPHRQKPFTGGLASGSDSTLGTFPSEVDGQLKLSKMFTSEATANKPPRAVVPGVLFIPQSGAWGPLANGDLLLGTDALAGRSLMVVPDNGAGANTSTPSGCYLVDITGPWR